MLTLPWFKRQSFWTQTLLLNSRRVHDQDDGRRQYVMWRGGFVGLEKLFLENVKVVGINVISFELVLDKKEKFFAV